MECLNCGGRLRQPLIFGYAKNVRKETSSWFLFVLRWFLGVTWRRRRRPGGGVTGWGPTIHQLNTMYNPRRCVGCWCRYDYGSWTEQGEGLHTLHQCRAVRLIRRWETVTPWRMPMALLYYSITLHWSNKLHTVLYVFWMDQWLTIPSSYPMPTSSEQHSKGAR